MLDLAAALKEDLQTEKLRSGVVRNRSGALSSGSLDTGAGALGMLPIVPPFVQDAVSSLTLKAVAQGIGDRGALDGIMDERAQETGPCSEEMPILFCPPGCILVLTSPKSLRSGSVAGH